MSKYGFCDKVNNYFNVTCRLICSMCNQHCLDGKILIILAILFLHYLCLLN